MPSDDRIYLAQPFVRSDQIIGVRGSGSTFDRRKPSRKPSAIGLGINIGPRSNNDIQPDLGSQVQEFVQVTNPVEIVEASFGRMITPIEITADRIEAAGFHLFEHVTPKIRAGQTKRMKFARVDEDAFTIANERVMIVSDRVLLAGRLSVRSEWGETDAKQENAKPGFQDRGHRRRERIFGQRRDSRKIRKGSGDRGEHRYNPR